MTYLFQVLVGLFKPHSLRFCFKGRASVFTSESYGFKSQNDFLLFLPQKAGWKNLKLPKAKLFTSDSQKSNHQQIFFSTAQRKWSRFTSWPPVFDSLSKLGSMIKLFRRVILENCVKKFPIFQSIGDNIVTRTFPISAFFYLFRF